MTYLIDAIIENLNMDEKQNKNLVKTLRKMRELGNQGKLLILNPLDGESDRVLN